MHWHPPVPEMSINYVLITLRKKYYGSWIQTDCDKSSTGIPGIGWICVFFVGFAAWMHCVAICELKQNGELPNQREREQNVNGKGHGRTSEWDDELRCSCLHSPATIGLTAYTHDAANFHTGGALCPMQYSVQCLGLACEVAKRTPIYFWLLTII